MNGALVETAVLEPGSEVGVGPYSSIFRRLRVRSTLDQGALRLDAERITMNVGEKQILAETTLSIEPGQFVAFIGERALGKDHPQDPAGVTTPSGLADPER